MADSARPPSGGPVTQPLVAFNLDARRFGLRLQAVERALPVMAITPLPGAPRIVLGVVDVAGAVLPVVDMRARFGLPARPIRLGDQLILAHTGRRPVALLVDAATGVLEVEANALTPGSAILPDLDLVEGAVMLEDGMVLVHDLARLLALDDEVALDRALAEAGR